MVSKEARQPERGGNAGLEKGKPLRLTQNNPEMVGLTQNRPARHKNSQIIPRKGLKYTGGQNSAKRYVFLKFNMEN